MGDQQLLDLWLEADTVRMRVSMMNALFLQKIARPNGASRHMCSCSGCPAFEDPSALYRHRENTYHVICMLDEVLIFLSEQS